MLTEQAPEQRVQGQQYIRALEAVEFSQGARAARATTAALFRVYSLGFRV